MKLVTASLRFFLFFFSVFLFFGHSPKPDPGVIYIVLGSDTAIWDGMWTSRYNNDYNPSLYVDANTNTTEVMNPAFRGQFRDSYGDTMKLTWWMMAGNIFRYSIDKNIPYPNIMTMYLMKQFHGDKINILGDELSLHYHTFTWTDYDQDGKYWWNQALNFTECFDDFNFTLAQLFLEEEVFPVSFRSGWHAMDNEWQAYLNKILPYSLHNDYPAKRTDTEEPLDNTFDWSLAPSVFIPFNPSPQNYQLQGNSKSWNVRSIHLNNIKNNTNLLNSIFAKADSGFNQVVCIWGHLPETDFNTNLRAIDSVLHKNANLHPGVNFKYCTGVEAMQLFRQGNDFTPPVLTVNEVINGNTISYNISVNEPVFQEQPFVAYKDLNENFHVVECTNSGTNSWNAVIPMDKQFVVKAGVVLTDTMGNQSKQFFRYLPDDIYVDNISPGYTEFYGNWTHNNIYAWGNNSRKASLAENDSAKVEWQFNITQENYYNIMVQFPKTTNHAGKIKYILHSPSVLNDTLFAAGIPVQEDWTHVFTKILTPGSYKLEMNVKGAGQGGKIITADVLKVSPIVREKAIQPLNAAIDLGDIAFEDSIFFKVHLRNNGFGNLIINDIASVNNILSPEQTLPLQINPFSRDSVKMRVNADSTGIYIDTLIVTSDDPMNPEIRIPFSAHVIPYFTIIDNEDPAGYFETAGVWSNSVAQAYGPTSRIAYLNQNPRAKAHFKKLIPKEGDYDISFIVPTTVNAATKALYRIYVNGNVTDTMYVDQNINSGQWVVIRRKYFNENDLVMVEIADPGGSQGSVLRTDALRLGIHDPALSTENISNLPVEFRLFQNYPNPFNPVTSIVYEIPAALSGTRVDISIYNALGQQVAVLMNEVHNAGVYRREFNASSLPSGVYFCRVNAGRNSSVIKMLLLK